MQLNRLQLYTWAWISPVSKIAETLNISGSALAKTCKRYRIPTPSRGYWRRLQAGQSLTRTPLPDPEDAALIPVESSEKQAIELNRIYPILDQYISAFKTAHPHGATEASTLARRPASKRGRTAFPTDSSAQTKVELKNARGPRPAELQTSPESSVLPPELTAQTKVELTNVPGATPAKLQISPESSVVLGLAERWRELEAAYMFLDLLQESAPNYDPATIAVIKLWVEYAKASLSHLDPIAQVAEACRRVAHGNECPAWWKSGRSPRFK